MMTRRSVECVYGTGGEAVCSTPFVWSWTNPNQIMMMRAEFKLSGFYGTFLGCAVVSSTPSVWSWTYRRSQSRWRRTARQLETSPSPSQKLPARWRKKPLHFIPNFKDIRCHKDLRAVFLMLYVHLCDLQTSATFSGSDMKTWSGSGSANRLTS